MMSPGDITPSLTSDHKDTSPPLLEPKTIWTTDPSFTDILTKNDKKVARQERQRHQQDMDNMTNIPGYRTVVRSDDDHKAMECEPLNDMHHRKTMDHDTYNALVIEESQTGHRVTIDEIEVQAPMIDILRDSPATEPRAPVTSPPKAPVTIDRHHPTPQQPPQTARSLKNPYATPTQTQYRNRNAAILSHHLEDLLSIFDHRQQEWLGTIRERDLLRIREESIHIVERELRRLQETMRIENIRQHRLWETEVKTQLHNRMMEQIQDAETILTARTKAIIQFDWKTSLETEFQSWMHEAKITAMTAFDTQYAKAKQDATTVFDTQYATSTAKYKTRIDETSDEALHNLYSNLDTFATQAKRIHDDILYQRPCVNPDSPHDPTQNHIPADDHTPTTAPIKSTRWPHVDVASLHRGRSEDLPAFKQERETASGFPFQTQHDGKHYSDHNNNRRYERGRDRDKTSDRNDQPNWTVNESKLNQLRSAQTNLQLR